MKARVLRARVCADLSAADREVQEGAERMGAREGKNQKALNHKSRVTDTLQDLLTRDQIWSDRQKPMRRSIVAAGEQQACTLLVGRGGAAALDSLNRSAWTLVAAGGPCDRHRHETR